MGAVARGEYAPEAPVTPTVPTTTTTQSGTTTAGTTTGTTKGTTTGSTSTGGTTTGITAQTYKASDGTVFNNYSDYQSYQDAIDQKLQGRQSAYNLLYQQFSQYGLGSLVEPLKDLISDVTVAPSEFSIRLQNTDAYKKRFSANADRIAKGLTALTPAQYLAMEDQYQNIMRNYGLPDTYWKTGELGTQEGFNKLLASDVSEIGRAHV